MSIVEELVKRNANVNFVTMNGNTAVMYAAAQGHMDVFNYLCDKV
jgi:ankyrin repeat protein